MAFFWCGEVHRIRVLSSVASIALQGSIQTSFNLQALFPLFFLFHLKDKGPQQGLWLWPYHCVTSCLDEFCPAAFCFDVSFGEGDLEGRVVGGAVGDDAGAVAGLGRQAAVRASARIRVRARRARACVCVCASGGLGGTSFPHDFGT